MLIWIRGKGVRPCGCLNTTFQVLCVGGGVFPRILILATRLGVVVVLISTPQLFCTFGKKRRSI
jgi:hypothetical protein